MYAWVDGKIKFYTHEKDGKYYFNEVEGATLLELPSAELVAKCEGKTFKNFSDAKAFIEGNDINVLKQQLAETDYKIIKCYEYQLAGLDLPYDIPALHAERQGIRDKINLLEGV